MILHKIDGVKEFLLPSDSNGNIKLAKGQEIELYCHSEFFSPIRVKKLEIACETGILFKVKGTNEEHEFDQFICNEIPQHTTRLSQLDSAHDLQIGCAQTGGALYQLGFDVEGDWLNILDICHDKEMYVTHWIYHTLGLRQWNAKYQRPVCGKVFADASCHGSVSLNTFYARKNVERILTKLLKKPGYTDNKDQGKGLFLSHGHLAPAADFPYSTLQNASYNNLNSALQWQKFNEENWQHIESKLREKAERRNWELSIFTGTYGILTLKNHKDEPTEVHLMPTKKRLPIPKIFFKIVIRGGIQSTKGAVYIGVNDPHATVAEIRGTDDANLLCRDVSHEIRFHDWPSNERSDVGKGFIYACRVSEFVTNIPSLGLSHLAHVTDPIDIATTL